MTNIKTLITAEELAEMRDVQHSELIAGEIVRTVPTQQPHGTTAAQIHGFVHPYVRTNRLGITGIAEVGYILRRDPDYVRVPDVSFVSRERIPPTGLPTGFWPFAPDLAVEVASPSDSRRDIESKVRQYLDAGTRLVWVANPRARTITVHSPDMPPRTLGADDVLDGGDVLPGFSVRVGDIFDPGF